MEHFDVVVVGAGAAGLFCAGIAGQRGLRVLLLDHAPKLAEKIRISGGGRCNFTNIHTTAANFLSANPHFCKSALRGYTPQDFIALVEKHGIAWHEKTLGQLFCDGPESRSESISSPCRFAQRRVDARLPAGAGRPEMCDHIRIEPEAHRFLGSR